MMLSRSAGVGDARGQQAAQSQSYPLHAHANNDDGRAAQATLSSAGSATAANTLLLDPLALSLAQAAPGSDAGAPQSESLPLQGSSLAPLLQLLQALASAPTALPILYFNPLQPNPDLIP